MISRIAARMAAIEPFHVMDVMARAQALELQGRSVIHMEVGEPDFPTPGTVIEAAKRSLDRGSFPYTLALGLPRLREAIARYYQKRYGLEVPPERIVVTSGSSGALLLIMAALVDSGASVLMADPGYPCNRQFVRLMGGEPVGMPVGADTAYQPTPQLIERCLTARTAAVLIASPANPTGTMIANDALAAIAALLERRCIPLIVDEIYHGLTYGVDAQTAAALSDHVFVINSFSKYFDMTGWRLGWLVAPEAYVREIEKLAQNFYICPSAPAQHAALAAFEPATIEILAAQKRI